MDKNAFLAIFVAFLLFVFWQYFFAPKVPEQAPPQGTKPPAVSTQPAPAPAPAPGLPPGAPVTPQVPARMDFSGYKTWSISDSLYKMNLLAPGARLSSFLLKDFRKTVDPNSPLINLTTTQDTGRFPLAIDLTHHKDWDLSTRLFESNAPESIRVEPGQPEKQAAFQTEIPGHIRLTKLFTFAPDAYYYDLEIQVDNISDEKLVDQLGLSLFFEPYPETTSYNQSQLTFSQNRSLHYMSVKDIANPEKAPKPPFDWVGYENNYFIQAMAPLGEGGYQIVPLVLDQAKGLIQVAYVSDPFDLPPAQTKSFKMRFYAGPKEIDRLNQAGRNLSDAVDYGWFSIIAKPLLVLLKWIYRYVHNYGFAIIIITIMIKIVFWPLTHKSYTSMQKMKKIQPKIAQIREKYKDDREKLNQELMAVYRTYKVNPAGGCLPMILQIPVFFALYRMLNAAVDLRHQPFMLWIRDLTAPDRLHIPGVDIPYLGGIPVLTLLMGITMFLQQRMTPSSGDPRQEKIMLMMPVMFTVFFLNFPAGLVLYWLVNNILSIAQQYWINRKAQR